jgi:hypothetical protein
MRKVYIIGAIAAVTSLSTTITSPALAKPVFFICVKEAGGKYENSKCSKEGALKEYNRKAPTNGSLYSSTATTPVIKTANHKFECSSYRSAGEISGLEKLTVLSLVFEKCKDQVTGKNCGTGANHEISTNSLEAELKFGTKGAKPPILFLFKPKSGTLWAKFKCEGGPPEPEYELLGSVLGKELVEEEAVTQYPVEFIETGGGAQEFTTIEEEAILGTFELEVKVVGGAKEKAVLKTTEVQKWPCPNMGIETK